MREIDVKVQSDHLERISRVKKPILAIAELIWNALDADATSVSVAFFDNGLGRLDRVVVKDNGHGLPFADVELAFGNLGGSWKRLNSRSREKHRLLHGQAGKGRFRAFHLGNNITWRTRYRDADGDVYEYSIVGQRTCLGRFSVDDKRKTSQAPGTEVEISNPELNFTSLREESALWEITNQFALYLRQYEGIEVIYEGSRIQSSLIEEHVSNYELPELILADGNAVTVALTIIEWKTRKERALVMCDANGFALETTTPGIQAPGFSFTAYLRSSFFRDLDFHGLLNMEAVQPDLKKVLETAKDTLRQHFRARDAEHAANLVQEWKKEKVYPYEGEPTNMLEAAERQVFDVLALSVNEYLPDFERAETSGRKLTLRLLKQGLERSPSEVQQILRDVLELPREKQTQLADLLNRTSLAAIINASRVVADRLDFIKSMEMLLFEAESKIRLLERTQLQRILVDHTWIFGERFNLTIDDESLDEVLAKHMKLLGRAPDEEVEPVLREDGRAGIVDLMLSRRIPLREDEREHLVIELKRPSKKLDDKIANQLESYAYAVANDERFRDTNTRWSFWAVSNEMTSSVRRKSSQRNRPVGLLHEDESGRLTIWVRTWAQILEDCSARLQFFQQRLEYAANHDSALSYLRRAHEQYIPSHLKKSTDH